MSKGKNLKYCHTCRKRLPIRFFAPNPKRKDGLDAHCDRCSGKRVETFDISIQQKKPQMKYDDYPTFKKGFPRRILPFTPPIHTFSRTCTRCGFEGHGEYFGWAREYALLLNSRCRKCQRELAAEYRKRPGYREKIKKYQKEYRKTYDGRESNQRYYHRNKGKIKARAATGYAILKGILPRPTTLACKACNNPAKEYHHRDYEDYLDVIPVCVICHRAAHRKYEPRAIEEKRAKYMNEDLYDPVIP